jgi:uncharacterized membrane protein YuzA (DUF378 family)
MFDNITLTLTNYTLLVLGSITGLMGLQQFDLIMAIFLKFVSLASFICFILINKDKIKEGWKSLFKK